MDVYLALFHFDHDRLGVLAFYFGTFFEYVYYWIYDTFFAEEIDYEAMRITDVKRFDG